MERPSKNADRRLAFYECRNNIFLKIVYSSGFWDFPGGTAVKNPPASARDARDVGLIPGLEHPLEEEIASHSSIHNSSDFFFPYVACGILISQPGVKPMPPTVEAWNLNHWTTREVTHSNILAWKIPWTEEPDGLRSMGPQRVGHD